MSQAIQPISPGMNIPSPQEVQASCLPNCVAEALQSVANLFSRIGMANLIGVSVIVLAASVFDALAGVVATVIFCTVKALTPRAEPEEAPPPQVAPPPPQVTPPQPPPPVRIPMRVEALPPGTIRSQFAQHNIWRHRYNVNNLNLEEPDLVDALAQAMPIRHYHDQTCCAMAATVIDYFYQHRFTDLTPIKLDALLAKAIHVDRAIRQRNPALGRREIEIFELADALQLDQAEGLQPVQLPAFLFDATHLPIQENLIPNNPQANIASFHDLLTQFLTQRQGAGPLAGSLLLNGHSNGHATGHFTGLCVDRDDQGQILQIYASESSSSFSEHVRYNSGDNRWGAMVVPIGNTIEAAAAELARFYSDAEMATLYQTTVPG